MISDLDIPRQFCLYISGQGSGNSDCMELAAKPVNRLFLLPIVLLHTNRLHRQWLYMQYYPYPRVAPLPLHRRRVAIRHRFPSSASL
jgi:hypothetical protein